ncbi:MAG: group 1 glycosyl transferase, partial [Parcubacteria group bacterium Athens1014_10]
KEIEINLLPSFDSLKNPFVNFWYSLKYLPKLYQADFVYYLAEFPYCFLFFWFGYLNKKFFIHAHGTFAVSFLDNFKYKFVVKKIYQMAEKIFCVSNFTKNEILKRVKLDNLVVTPNGVNFEKFSYPSNKHNFSPSPQEKIILSVGALKNRKGYHISIPAFALVLKNFPQLKYYIVGDQRDVNYYQKLQNLVEKHQLKGRVIFLEKIDDEQLIDLYYQSFLFLLTSIIVNQNKFEGFGLVYLEANACAKPVIGTYGCGAEEAIRNGYNGLLVPQNDIEKTAEAILKILSNPSLAKEMGVNGKIWAKKHEWSKMIKECIKFIKI